VIGSAGESDTESAFAGPHGQRDATISVAIAEAMATAIPECEVVVIPGAGHVPTLTRPGDVVDAIESWATAAFR
jgi:pimeloyl-ACP methyl ester carboxylesterase